jgi:integrase
MRALMNIVRNKHGVYHAQQRVPKGLGEAVARVLGKDKLSVSWLKRSLGTKDLREANIRAKPVLMEFDAILARAAETLKQKPLRTSLTPSEIARMAEYHYAWMLANHDEALRQGPFTEAEERKFMRQFALEDGEEPPVWNEPIPQFGLSGGQMADLADFLALRTPEAEAALARGDITYVDWQIEHALETFQINLDRPSAAYRQLGLVILREHVRALRAIRQRSQGEPIETPPVVLISAGRTGEGETISAAFEGWKKARGPSPTTALEYQRAIRLFVELHGDLPVAQIKRSHARTFREALQEVPRQRSGELVNASLPELVQWSSKHKVAKITAGTINKLFGAVQTVAVWARDNGVIPEDVPWSDPFSKMRLEEDEPSRAPFTREELQWLFASPVFTSGARPIGGKGEAAFWLPLLARFTGARQGELAGLRPSDIETDEVTGAPLLIIAPERSRNRTLKTRSSARTVPIHKELIRLGWLDYVEQIRNDKGKDVWLFHLIAPEHGRAGVRAWSKWFNRHLGDQGVTDTSKVFHSFRHTFSDALRATGISTEGLRAILGWSGGVDDAGTATRYGAKEKFRRFGRVLIEAVEKVTYPSLDLSKVQWKRRTQRRTK